MAERIRFILDGKAAEIDADPAMPLLYALRSDLGATAPKFGCGLAQCGACTVHVDGRPTRSCITPAAAAKGKKVNRPDQPAAGAGEPSTGTVPAAIANAIFDATGVRLRRVPLKPERVKAALART